MVENMRVPEYFDVDPRTLHLPSTRPTGADPLKLQRQIAQYGASTQGIPPIFVYRAIDGGLIIFAGVTRATRVAKLQPGALVLVEVIGELSVSGAHLPTIGEKLS
jgi:hypothetical protein